jgi:hypothetical protein
MFFFLNENRRGIPYCTFIEKNKQNTKQNIYRVVSQAPMSASRPGLALCVQIMNKSLNSFFHPDVDNCWLSKIMLFRCIQILQDAIIITSMKQPFGNCPFCSSIISITGKDKSQIMCSNVQHSCANSHSKIRCFTVSSIPQLQRTQLTVGMLKRFHLRRFLVFSWSLSNNQKNTLCLAWH